MNEEERKAQEKKLTEEAAKLSDLDIAELANKELKRKELEIAKLKKELAQAKLYSVAEDEEPKVLTREECIKQLGNNRITNYDYAETVCNLVDIEKADGKSNPLGKNGEEVYKFFKDVIEECGDDKSRFPSIYQARLGNDPTQTAMAYKNRK